MSNRLEELLKAAADRNFTEKEKEEHRRSFAYGNTHIENDRITREMIDEEADKIDPEPLHSADAR